MKFSSTATSLLLLSSVTFDHANIGVAAAPSFLEEESSEMIPSSESNLPRGLQTSTPCFEYPLKFESQDASVCSYESFKIALQAEVDAECGQGYNAVEELKKALVGDGNLNDQKLENYITDLCIDSLASRLEQDGITYEQILQNEATLAVKEFFDGGGWNERRQTKKTIFGVKQDIHKDYPGKRIEDIQAGYGDQGLVIWPYGVSNFELGECAARAVMCCFVQDIYANGNGQDGDCETRYDQACVDADPADNTDICSVDMSDAPDSSRVEGGYALFPGASEGNAHCHGFAWKADELDVSAVFKASTLHYVSLYDHFNQRGYVRSVPGAPMCGCIEKMPVVSESDCTQLDNVAITTKHKIIRGAVVTRVTDVRLEFASCQGVTQANDLLDHYRLINGGDVTPVNNKLVEDCTPTLQALINTISA